MVNTLVTALVASAASAEDLVDDSDCPPDRSNERHKSQPNCPNSVLKPQPAPTPFGGGLATSRFVPGHRCRVGLLRCGELADAGCADARDFGGVAH